MTHPRKATILPPFQPSINSFGGWLAAEPSLLQQYTVDRNRFRIIGLTVGCTGVFAVLAWTYFFSTTTAPTWSLLPLGFFMGFVIVNIDRALDQNHESVQKAMAAAACCAWCWHWLLVCLWHNLPCCTSSIRK
ncbi:DUF4407 domain-containing protein [Phnomibacter ginsenosidimutans]|uniref:DUF4407 domain-containing protein n=1 Tax=Phnomibacter ginsenosidimutans TaxID=2676868 RepID=A0A6I6GRD9_9BACT|nr:DUF4407 domain-containing protein [Phnomibacter ginsenosidimutans]